MNWVGAMWMHARNAAGNGHVGENQRVAHELGGAIGIHVNVLPKAAM